MSTYTGGSRYRTLTMFNNVTSFHESASERLYRDRSRGSELGPILGCRHPVARNERPQVAKTRAFVMGTRLDVSFTVPTLHEVRLVATGVFATGPVAWMGRMSWKHASREDTACAPP